MATLQHRRGNAADLAYINPLPAEGELMIELDCGRIKIGDGIRNWNDLPYFIDAKINLLVNFLYQNGVLSVSDFGVLNSYNCPCRDITGGSGVNLPPTPPPPPPPPGPPPPPTPGGNELDGGFI